ncbi:hypothetical protein DFJ58DRAFT_737864 [Suillus subalutaceus]|uniref:uncharacterized protein n=1 Tax=Suillus subalutaceus TaxID=48586 RepID=UPI001B86DEDD|nr:uncharacterized protein DFJ58DRAFT_737864 [Suillus subalutaceus]KAG1828309.1 hypothetical protein DFJ58DRAFT_737864 [Suillus subalutaceus]
MPGGLEERYIKLAVISGKNREVPSERFPTGIYASVSYHRMNLSSRASPLSVEIYELRRMLGSGEVIGQLKTLWDEMLDHGDEPFGSGVHGSVTCCTCLRRAGQRIRYIAQDTDAGHTRFAEYMTSSAVPHLNDSTYDDLAHGENYRIPAGTMVFGNHCHCLGPISRDSDVYPEPYAFKPQRFE